jgi:hypothetical protein
MSKRVSRKRSTRAFGRRATPKRRAPAKRSSPARKAVVRYRTKIQRVRVRRNPRGMLTQPAVRFGLAAVVGAVVAGALDQSVLAGRVGPFKPSQAAALITGLLSRSKLIKGAGNKAIATGAAVGMLYPTAQQYIAGPVATAVAAIANPIAGMLPSSSSADQLTIVQAPARGVVAAGGARR